MLWARSTWRPCAQDTSRWDWQYLSTPIRVLADEAVVRNNLGQPTHPRGAPDGSDDFDAWFLEHPCGLRVVLCHPPNDGDHWWINTNDDDLDHTLHHVALPARETWRLDHERAETWRLHRVWALWRYDDNGQQFEVHRFMSRLAAECSLRTFEARGHRQTYVVERVSEASVTAATTRLANT